jgi:NADH-quinone oxidoreductase subunit H
MFQTLDQIFVTAKHRIVEFAPAQWQPLISVLLSIIPILAVFPLLFAVTTVLERKGLGRIQNRYGPNRVGPCGVLQPVADGLKTLFKESVQPRAAEKLVFFLAPVVLIIPAFLAYSVIPYGRNMVPLDMDAGLLFFFAVGAGTELAVFMAGWASRNKYSLLGAMRAIAQMLSYEIPLILSAVPVVMLAGTLSPAGIVQAQDIYTGTVAHWNVFKPWGLAGFILFLIAAAAESNRSPFDLPEGESEIIAGYYIEYSGFKFALFFLGEYLGLFAVCSLGITLFLGGYTVLDLVFQQIAGAHLLFHLGARNDAARAHGSTNELRLEIHAADGADKYCGRCCVAVYPDARVQMDRLRADCYDGIFCAGSRIDAQSALY